MSSGEFLALPPYVAILLVVMFSPAILAATEFVAALSRDPVREKQV
jgi:hypothetical protein